MYEELEIRLNVNGNEYRITFDWEETMEFMVGVPEMIDGVPCIITTATNTFIGALEYIFAINTPGEKMLRYD